MTVHDHEPRHMNGATQSVLPNDLRLDHVRLSRQRHSEQRQTNGRACQFVSAPPRERRYSNFD